MKSNVMDSVKVSIIIPIYNVERYIHKLVENIKLQKHENFEVIFVDDGSTDNSLSLLKKASLSDERFIVYHQSNSGTGASRNLGTKFASGKYLYYMDPDDSMDPALLYDNLHIIDNAKADVIVFGFETVDENGNHLDDKKYNVKQQHLQGNSVRDYFEELYQEYFFHALWHKLIRRDFVVDNGIIAPTWSNSQDRGFMVRVGNYNPKIVFNFADRTYYKYVKMRNESSTAKYKENLLEISLLLANQIKSLIINNSIVLNDKIFYMTYIHDVYFYAGITNFLRRGAPKNKFEVNSYLKAFYEEQIVKDFLCKSIINTKGLTWKEKIIFLSAKYKLSVFLLQVLRIRKSF